MTANEAKQLTLQSRNNLVSSKVKIWQQLNKYISEQIEEKALEGLSQAILDLSNDQFSIIRHEDYEFLKEKLELDGYNVIYVLDKDIFGKRAIVISWE